jgi:hypothetical protein
MSALIFPDRWRRQPTTPVGIDWGHPLAQGLKHGLTGVRPLVDQVSGVGYTVAASGGVTIEPHWSAQGQTLLFSSQATVQPRLSLASPWRPGASDFTVSCWAVFLRESVDRDTMVVAVRYDSGSEFEWSLSGNWAATDNDYRPGFYIRTNNGGGTFYGAYFASKRIIGVPVFVTGVRRGNTVSIYRDGVLEQETATAGTLQTATTGLTLGSGLNNPVFNFNGYLPQFVMWSRALSQSEIRAYVEAPWQFFRPIQRRIYVPSVGGGGSSDHALTESSSAADTLAAAAAFAAASAESSAAAETLAAILQAQASAAESVAASDTLAAAAQSSVAAGESAAAADTLAATGYQRGAPDADVDVGAWLASTGADLAALLRDADSGTYIYTTSKESAYLADVKRASGSDLDDPGADAGYEIVVELAGGYTPSGEIEVEVLQGATVIATRTISSPVAGQTYTWTVTEGEAAAITNHSALRQRVTVH